MYKPNSALRGYRQYVACRNIILFMGGGVIRLLSDNYLDLQTILHYTAVPDSVPIRLF